MNELTMLKNSQEIDKIKFTGLMFNAKCPIGNDIYIACVDITLTPDKYYPDIDQVRDTLNGFSGKIATTEDSCKLVYDFMMCYNPLKLKVKVTPKSATLEKNTAMGYTVVKKYKKRKQSNSCLKKC